MNVAEFYLKEDKLWDAQYLLILVCKLDDGKELNSVIPLVPGHAVDHADICKMLDSLSADLKKKYGPVDGSKVGSRAA